ncbi:hypothetical protein ACFL0X_01535, partial [Nanoarchaeota archaeon]
MRKIKRKLKQRKILSIFLLALLVVLFALGLFYFKNKLTSHAVLLEVCSINEQITSECLCGGVVYDEGFCCRWDMRSIYYHGCGECTGAPCDVGGSCEGGERVFDENCVCVGDCEFGSGDINQDGEIDQDDVDIFQGHLGDSCGAPDWCSCSDINQDEIVDISDYNLMGQQVDECSDSNPCSEGYFCIGGICVIQEINDEVIFLDSFNGWESYITGSWGWGGSVAFSSDLEFIREGDYSLNLHFDENGMISLRRVGGRAIEITDETYLKFFIKGDWQGEDDERVLQLTPTQGDIYTESWWTVEGEDRGNGWTYVEKSLSEFGVDPIYGIGFRWWNPRATDFYIDEVYLGGAAPPIPACIDGSIQPCGSDVGSCEYGEQTCDDGVWGDCEGGISPTDEICDNEDNDCDGGTDEGLVRGCISSGVCVQGTQTCEEGHWGGCDGRIDCEFDESCCGDFCARECPVDYNAPLTQKLPSAHFAAYHYCPDCSDDVKNWLVDRASLIDYQDPPCFSRLISGRPEVNDEIVNVLYRLFHYVQVMSIHDGRDNSAGQNDLDSLDDFIRDDPRYSQEDLENFF